MIGMTDLPSVSKDEFLRYVIAYLGLSLTDDYGVVTKRFGGKPADTLPFFLKGLWQAKNKIVERHYSAALACGFCAEHRCLWMNTPGFEKFFEGTDADAEGSVKKFIYIYTKKHSLYNATIGMPDYCNEKNCQDINDTINNIEDVRFRELRDLIGSDRLQLNDHVVVAYRRGLRQLWIGVPGEEKLQELDERYGNVAASVQETDPENETDSKTESVAPRDDHITRMTLFTPCIVAGLEQSSTGEGSPRVTADTPVDASWSAKVSDYFTDNPGEVDRFCRELRQHFAGTEGDTSRRIAGVVANLTYRMQQTMIKGIEQERDALKDELRAALADDGQLVAFKPHEERNSIGTDIENARRVWISGRNLDVFMRDYRGYVERAADDRNRTEFRFLLADLADEPLRTVLSRASLSCPTEDTVVDASGRSSGVIEELRSQAPHRIDIQRTRQFQAYTQIIVNPGEETSRMIIEFYGYKIAGADRFHIDITKQTHAMLYNYYLDQFEYLWNEFPV